MFAYIRAPPGADDKPAKEKTMSKTIVLLADGLEECEGLTVVDLLRRAGAEVTTVSINGTKTITSSHSIIFQADETAESADFDSADLLVLPGGLKGTDNLAASPLVAEQCRRFAASKKLAAICAAPGVLAGLGLLDGKRATIHPACEDRMNSKITLTHESVTVDGNITTGNGLAASIAFGLELVRQLEGEEAAAKVAKGISLKI